MSVVLKKAARSRAFLKIGLSGASGSGKTLSALLLAYGMIKEENPKWTDEEIWNKIAVIDTENGSGSLYVGRKIHGVTIGEYNSIDIEPPFTPEKYTDGIDICEDAGLLAIVIDSLSHAWTGEGGLLDQQGAAAKRSGNSYTAWRDITPKHNRLVDRMLQSHLHVIVTTRAKTEYVQEKDGNGKTTVRKIGLAPIFREGLEFEFTTFLEIDSDHTAFGAKDRTGLFDQQSFIIEPKHGRQLQKWRLQAPESTVEKTVAVRKASEVEFDIPALQQKALGLCKLASGVSKEVRDQAVGLVVKHAPQSGGNPLSVTDPEALTNLIKELEEIVPQKGE